MQPGKRQMRLGLHAGGREHRHATLPRNPRRCQTEAETCRHPARREARATGRAPRPRPTVIAGGRAPGRDPVTAQLRPSRAEHDPLILSLQFTSAGRCHRPSDALTRATTTGPEQPPPRPGAGERQIGRPIREGNGRPVPGVFVSPGIASQAFAARHFISEWWMLLVIGLLEVPLGVLALADPGATLAAIITVGGIWAVAVGVRRIVLSFEVKRLPRTVEEASTQPTRNGSAKSAPGLVSIARRPLALASPRPMARLISSRTADARGPSERMRAPRRSARGDAGRAERRARDAW